MAYDNPSYLTRQQIQLGVSTAGANGTSGGVSFVSDMRIRRVSACVRTAGTSATTGNQAMLLCIGTMVTGFTSGSGFTLTTSTGTNTVGFIALGSTAALTVSTSTDMNTRITAGSTLALKNGTDATGVYAVTVEMHADPDN